MLKVKIENFLGCKSAEFEIDGITNLHGYNFAGKSSILKAVAHAASLTKLSNKERAKAAITDGEASGCVAIETEEGEQSLTLPENETIGLAVKASELAVGLFHYPTLDSKDRFSLLSQTLKADPTKKDLEAELKKAGFDDVAIDNAWKSIYSTTTNKANFPAAHATYKKNRTTMTGRWCEVTKARQWGEPSGAAWSPEGFTRDEMLAVDVAKAKEIVEEMDKAIVVAAGQVAISEAAKEELEAKIKTEPALKELALETVKRVEALQKHCEELLQSGGAEVIRCCNCDSDLVIDDGFTRLATAEDMQTIDEDAVKRAKLDLKQLQAEMKDVEAKIAEVNAAKAKLKSAKVADPDAVKKAQAKADKARAKLQAVERFIRANDLHEQIVKTVTLIELTAPDGLPGKKLRSVIEKFNKRIAELCAVGEWGTVRIERDSSVTYNNRPYADCSESEQLRIDATLQCAFAEKDGSQLVIVDRVDALDNRDCSKAGLIWMLDDYRQTAGGDVLIATKLDTNTDPILPLEKNEYGRSYWVQDGVLYPIADAVKFPPKEVEYSEDRPTADDLVPVYVKEAKARAAAD